MDSVTAAAGLLDWRAFFPHLNSGVVLILAVGVRGLLFFMDGYVSGEHRT
ncbi:hypothetical protein [Natronobacterium texcoconense]|uniref:Uncharacterized protein n=1 Tax=Natronobacterium texcoconense TaxID=1095778 RepID=A0A1H1J253_NATTX|nr:hypothetical protein [Natronobacterium texcoconense]SDR44077.1 hypothetical protein SAMN04489842_4047 [Natronobacterium texcoconense]